MKDTLSVLIVDDDESNREYLSAMIEAFGFNATVAASGEAGLAVLARPEPPDLVILDVVMPGLDGVATLSRYRASGGRVPVIMCSALDEADTVVRAMRAGATDYITKPFNAEELREVLERAAGQTARPRIIARAARPGATHLGQSPAMRAVDELVERIADADVPVLITGESGVGKDVVAREIHARSQRSSKVFIKINCAALPGELLESELFGHERGSFTGADRQKPGQFELANGGTLFLDEIGEMPVSLQAKLLQALQDGEFYRVGGQRKVKVDTRVIVATNVDLARAIARGTFREDLYYRLNVVQVAIPPLRERREDIPMLLDLFLEKYGQRYGRPVERMPHEILERFRTYDFPGNIRELENLVRRLIVLREPRYVLSELKDRSQPIGTPPMPVMPAGLAVASALPPPSLAAPLGGASQYPIMTQAGYAPLPPSLGTLAAHAGGEVAAQALADDYRIDLKELGRRASNAAEREAIILMLGQTGGNKREAAERLGISYKAILYKIRDFGICRPRRRRPPVVGPGIAALAATAAAGGTPLPIGPAPTSIGAADALPLDGEELDDLADLDDAPALA